jgi:hypothetical protein
MANGRRKRHAPPLAELRERFETQLRQLPDTATRLDEPEVPLAVTSNTLNLLNDEVRSTAQAMAAS